jgi:hypothetical protein
VVFYKKNPYLFPPINFNEDPFLQYTISTWRDKTIPYGPLWIYISSIANLIGKNNIYVNLSIFRCLNAFFFLMFLWVIYAINKLKEMKEIKNYALLCFLALNPFLIMEVIYSCHNDIVIAFFVALALFFYVLKKYDLAIYSIVFSLLIKPLALLLLPLFFITFLKSSIKQKCKKNIFILILVTIAIILIFYLPWIKNDIYFFNGLFLQLQKADSRFFYGFIPYWIFSFFDFINFNYSLYFQFIKLGSFAVFMVFYFYFLVKHYKENNFNSLIKYSLLIYIFYFFISCFWLQPWYLIILIPFLALDFNLKNILYLLLITVLGLLSYVFSISILILLFLIFYLFYLFYKFILRDVKNFKFIQKRN